MPSASPDPLLQSQETVAAAPGKPAHPRPAHKHPEQIGPFRILEKIGEGGMGIVYKAEQREPVRRIVALKVIKLGMDTKEVVARFEAERQALAMLTHPNVARVFEAGMTENGRPYFAMEYVAGVPLTQYCREHEFTTKQRLDIFIPICQAVQHAHQKGIIHRDLKPTNILVMLVDGNPMPKVIDFGIAKATNQALTQHTLFTETGALIGTPEYMSPEQAQTSGLDVDTRTDIFSLGVILYELLTGSLPINPKSLREAGLEGMARLIRTAEPQKPSTRLTTLAGSAKPDTLSGRTRDLRATQKEVRGDLDWIVLKAIEKDRSRRYETANALALDIRRHLDNEPVVARPPSAAYRFQKAFRRNRVAFVATGLVLTALLLGICVSAWQAVRATRAQGQAAENEKKANQSAAQATQSAALARQAQQQADQARAASEAEAYRAIFSEARALRAGREPGWREKALDDLARLAVMPIPRRDLPELRTEAAAALATPDIRLVAKVAVPYAIGSLTFTPDGRTLITAHAKTGLDLWDVAGRRHRASALGLVLTDSGFNTLVYVPGTQGLAVGTRDGVVFTDEFGSPTNRAPIKQGSSQPTKLAISADGKRIAVSWSDNGGTTIHDATSGALLAKFASSNPIFALSPNGQLLALQENSEIVLLSIGADQPRIVLGHHDGAPAQAVDFSPDGTILAASFDDHTCVLWNVVRREQFSTLRGHRERVRALAFSPDGEWIATGSFDYTTRIWETRTGQNIATLPALAGPVFGLKWSATGDYLAASVLNAQEIFLYRITGHRQVQQWLIGHEVELGSVEAHPLLERLTTSGYTELCNWDLAASRPSPVAIGPNPGAVSALAYSPDGSVLAVASYRKDEPGEVLIRDANTGKVKGRFSGLGLTKALAFDANGEHLACGDIDGKITLWNLATSHPIQKFATGSWVWSIVFLDRPRSLVTHGGSAVLLFNLDSGRLERKVDLAGGIIRKLVTDRAHSQLVVGFESGALGGLSLPDLTPGRHLQKAHDGSVACLALSPDGRLVASGADHRVVLRDAMSFEELLRLPLWDGTLHDLTFDSKSRRLAAVASANEVDLWDLAALRNGLAEIGLAWDQPASQVAKAGPTSESEHPTQVVPTMRRPGGMR